MSTEEQEKKPASDEDEEDDDEDVEKLQAEIMRMEAEANRIAKETEELESRKSGKQTAGDAKGGTAASTTGNGETPNRDGHSIYVGQVDYSATPEELLSHFEACGTVERVTIVCDKFTGTPKGFAYLEFSTEQAVENAVKLDGSQFKGRQLKVTPKRVNIAGFNHQQEGAGGRGRGGRGAFRGGRGRGGFRGGGRGHRGGPRGGRGGYHPYY